MEYTKGIPSPENLRLWAGISTVTAALERRVYTYAFDSILRPNLYVLLVAPPGVGKSMAIREHRTLLDAAGNLRLASDSITKAGLIDFLAEQPQVFNETASIYHSAIVASGELGVLVPTNDLAFLNTLNELYDCNSHFKERTRGGGLIEIDNPHVNLLSGTQPSYLGTLLPEAAWEQGFTARLILVYSALPVKQRIFQSDKRDANLYKALVNDIRHMGRLHGEVRWAPAAAEALEQWHEQDLAPVPTAIRLRSYNTRRIIHILKLSMVMSLERGDSMVVELSDFERAREILLSAEADMAEVFKEMTQDPSGKILDDAYQFVFERFVRGNRSAVPHSALYGWLAGRVPVQTIQWYIQALLSSGRLKNMSAENMVPTYAPVSRD